MTSVPQLGSLRRNGGAGHRLLVSGFGETGGGLWEYDGSNIAQVDDLSCTGLFVDGDRLLRLLRSDPDLGGPGELLVYDHGGLRSYHRVDELRDPHDVAVSDGAIVAVSSEANSVFWLDRGGTMLRSWRAPGEDDSWHLNCLCPDDGRLLLAAFGRYESHREWAGDLRRPNGILLDLASMEEVVTGLVTPHTPTRAGDAVLVCESVLAHVTELDRQTWAVRRRREMEGFTRGLAPGDDYLFVGLSAPRHGGQGIRRSRVAVLDAASWEPQGHFELPCEEIYELRLIPDSLAAGVRRGAQPVGRRTVEAARNRMLDDLGLAPTDLWRIGLPLGDDQTRARVRAELPARLAPGEVRGVPCRVTNTGSFFLASAHPFPVLVGSRWTATDGREAGQQRARLPRLLAPGDEVDIELVVRAPPAPGRYRLSLGLVQENVRWFDSVDREGGIDGPIEVG